MWKAFVQQLRSSWLCRVPTSIVHVEKERGIVPRPDEHQSIVLAWRAELGSFVN